MAQRVQPRETQQGGYSYDPGTGQGARRSTNTGNWGPDADAIRDQGQSTFREMYQRVAAENERADREEEEPRREKASDLDRLASAAYDFGEWVSRAGGLTDSLNESDNPVANAAGFVVGLPFGTLGAMPQGAAQAYEAATGRGVTGDDEGEDEVSLLDSNQRVASGVNAAINLVGPFAGGSGSMLRGGYRAARAGLGRLTGQAASEGVERATTNALKDTASRFLSPQNLRHMAGEAAEEGAEEFVQSLADDARFGTSDEGSLGRAVQSAALGALGGGIMSAGGYGLNKLAARLGGGGGNENSQTDDPTTVGQSSVRDTDAYRVAYGNESDRRSGYVTQSAQEVMEKRLHGSSAYQPGSSSVMLQQTDRPGLGINDSVIGAEDIKSIWMAPDDGRSQAIIESSLGLTHEQAQQMFQGANWDQDALIDHVRGLIDGGNAPRMYWARNPATKGRQPIMTNLVDVHRGSGLQLHPMVTPLVGADFDGDKSFVTFNSDGTDNAAYATSTLVDPETGELTLAPDEWSRSGISTYLTRDQVSEYVSNAVADARASYSSRNNGAEAPSIDQTALDTAVSDMQDALEGGDWGEFGRSVTMVADAAREAGLDSDAMVNELVSSMSMNDDANLMAAINHAIEVTAEVPDFSALSDESGETVIEEAPGIPGSGSMPRGYTMAQVESSWNLMAAVVTRGKNPTFREFGRLGYRAKSFDTYVRAAENIVSLTDAAIGRDSLAQFVVNCMRETERGSTVENSIAGKLNAYIVSRTVTRSGLATGRIRTNDDIDSVLREFVAARNQASRWADEATKLLTTKGWMTDESQLAIGELELTDDPHSNPVLVREFYKTFRDQVADDILYGLPDQYSGMTLDEMVSELSKMDFRTGMENISAGLDVNALIETMVEYQSRTAAMVSDAIYKSVAEVTERLNYLTRSGIIDAVDLTEATYLLDVISRYVGEEQMFTLGITDPVSLVNSRWGREIASGDADRAMKAVVSMSLTAQYRPLITMLREAGTDEGKLNYARYRINEMGLVDRLHGTISIQMLTSEDGTSELLDYLTDLDVSWRQTVTEYLDMVTDEADDPQLVVMALSNRREEFDMADISARRKKANSSMTAANKANAATIRQEISDFRAATDRYSDVVVVSALENLASDAVVSMDNSAMAAMIYDAAGISNSSLEKATLETAAQLYGVSMETMIHGGMYPELTKAINENARVMSVDDFVSNRVMLLGVISGQIDGVWVYDPTSVEMRSEYVTRDKIFSDASPEYDSQLGVTKNDWLRLLDKYPQLYRMIAPQSVRQYEVSGRPSVQLAMSQTPQSYLESVDRMFSATGRDGMSTMWEIEAKRRIRNEIRRVPGLPARIVQCIVDIDSKLDPRTLQREIDRYMDDFVDACYWRVLTNQAGDEYATAMSGYRMNVLVQTAEDMSQLIANTRIIQIIDQMRGGVQKSVETEFTQRLSDNLFNIVVGQYVSDIATGEAGLDVAGVPVTNADIDEVSRVARDAQREMAEQMEDITKAFAIIMETSSSQEFDAVLRVSRGTKDSMIDRINRSDALTDDQKSGLVDMINDDRAISTIMASVVGQDVEIITDADLSPEMRGADVAQAVTDLQQKARRVWRSTDTYEPYPSDMDDMIARAVTGTEEDGSPVADVASSRAAVKNEINNEVVAGIMRRIQQSTPSRPNTNMLMAMVSAGQVDHEIEAAARRAMSEWDGFVSGTAPATTASIGTMEFPMPHFISNTAQIIVNKLNATDVPASKVSTDTGVNGAMYKTDAGFATISDNVICDTAPTQMTSADIRAIVEAGDSLGDLSRLHVCRPRNPQAFSYDKSGRGSSWTLGVLSPQEVTEIMTGANPDRVWYVFRHEDCDNGICVAHQPAPVGIDDKGYVSIKNIVSRINQYAQEAMNLKRKKKPSSLSILGSKMGGGLFDGRAVAITATFDDPAGASAFNAIRGEMATDRRVMEDHLTDWLLSDDMSGLGYGRDQARILSQATVQGVHVTMVDENGTTHQRIMPHSATMSQDAMAAWFDGISSEVGSRVAPTMVRPYVTPIDMISYRAMINVIDHVGDGLSLEDTERYAYEGATDLSSIRPGTLSVSSILSRVQAPGISPAGTNTVSVASTPSGVAALMDVMSGETNHTLRNAMEERGYGYPNERQMARIEHFNSAYRKSSLRDNKLNLTIVRAFGRPGRPGEASVFRNSPESVIDRMRVDAAGALSDIGDASVSGGAAILFDPYDVDALAQAVNWSKTHGQRVLVPTASIERNIPMALGSLSQPYAITSVEDGVDIEFRAYDPSRFSTDVLGINLFQAASQRLPKMDRVHAVMLSTPGMSIGDAASLGNLDVMGDIYRRFSLSEDQSARTLLAGNAVAGPTMLANRADIDQIAIRLSKGDLSSVNLRYLTRNGVSQAQVDEMVSDWLSWYNSSDDGSTGPSTARPGQIVQWLVSRERGTGRTVYTPVNIAMNAPRANLRSVYVRKSGDTVSVNFDSEIDYADALSNPGNRRIYSSKIALESVSMKSEATFMSPGRYREMYGYEMPKVAATINGTNLPVSFVVDRLAEEGRAPGFNRLIDSNNIYYYMHSQAPFSPFFVRQSDGSYGLSEDLRRKLAEDERVTPGLLRDMLVGSGDPRAWDRVATGEITLTYDDEINRIVRDVVRQCRYAGGVSPLLFFQSMSVPPSDLDAMLANNGTGTVTKVGGYPVVSPDISQTMILGPFGKSKILRLYNWIDSRLCPREEGIDTRGQTVFNDQFQTYVDLGVDSNGEHIIDPQDVFWGPVYSLGRSSQEGTPSTQAKRGPQMINNQAMDAVAAVGDETFFVRWYAELINRPDILERLDRRDMVNDDRTQAEQVGFQMDPDQFNTMLRNQFTSAVERSYMDSIRRAGDIYSRPLNVRDGISGNVYTTNQLMGVQEVATAVSELNRALRRSSTQMSRGRDLTIDEVLMLVSTSTGTTINDGRGSQEMPLKVLTTTIEEMTRNLNEGKLPITVRRTNVGDDGRFAIALMPRSLAQNLYDASPRIRDMYQTFDDFQSAMQQENQACLEAIGTIRDKAKRDSIYHLVDWNAMTYGIRPPTDHIYGEVWMSDMVKSHNGIIRATMGSVLTADGIRNFEEMARRETERYARLAKENDLGTYHKTETEVAHNGELLSYERRRSTSVDGFLRGAAELSRFMAMLDPMISVANVSDRIIHQGMTNAMMSWCMDHGVGPYKSNLTVDQDTVRQGADSADAEKVFDMLRYASYDGDEGRVLTGITSMGDVDNYLSTRKKALDASKFRKASEFVFEFAGGGKFMQKYQIRNWYNQFIRIISSDRFKAEYGGDPSLLALVPREDGTPGDITLAELQWARDPGGFLIQVFNNRDNPYHTAAIRALNFSRAGEATQSNILYALYSSLAKRHPAVEFFTTTFVSRFFLYSTNMTGRVLNLVAPVSSVSYVLNDLAARVDRNGRYNFEGLQMYTSLREAIQVDLLHMSPVLLAMFLGMIPGLVEPPEDEDKRGNPDEWTIAGMRIGDDWLISDTLGVGIPVMTYFASMRTGDNRMDLIWNGLTQACYNNPVLKATTAVESLFDPESTFITDIGQDYASDVETYEDAPGGSPDFVTWLMGKAWGNGISYVSQFVTPTFVRNLANSYEMDQYERAYRYVQATDSRGEPVIDPDTGMPEYQETSYMDAQTRRVTRMNPVMGLLIDIFGGAWASGTTGYTRWEMPRTVYYDDAQIQSMRMFSVNDEDGNPLPADQQQEKVYMALSMLMSYDDMDELAATGFYLDYDTKMLVGDTIHDIIQSMRDQYSQMNAAGYLDYYYLGNGDYATGRAMKEQIDSEYYAEIAFWNSLYYDKLWSEQMRRPLTQYNRYNTTYAQDDNGEWYATGIFNSANPIAQVIHWAPGTLSEPSGYTTGWENDWNAPSAVTGQPMDQRALIPVEQGYLDTPDIDSLGDDSNDGYTSSMPGYSYSKVYGNNGYSRSYGGYGGSGGYGYSRRRSGGGGGGSYSPNIYSRLPNVYAPTARTMYSERIYSPNYDYLRPNFETKGSREAYKRSDI